VHDRIPSHSIAPIFLQTVPVSHLKISREPRPVSDAVFEEARRHFSERELVDLTLVCVTINGWNRFCVAFRAVPGEYQPAQHAAAKGAS